MRNLILAAAAFTLPSATPAMEPSRPIEWSIQRSGTAADARTVQLTIESRWNERSRSTWSKLTRASWVGS